MTPAQKEVAALAASGLTNKQIAQALGKSLSTVKNQINAIYGSGAVVNRNELRMYYRAGQTGEMRLENYQSARSQSGAGV